MRVAWLLVLVGVGMAAGAACGEDESAIDRAEAGSGSSSGSSSGRTGSSSGGSGSSGGSSSGGSGSSGGSSSSGSSGAVDAGNVGVECVFSGNAGCDPGLRCECEDDVNCTCQPGARGTGAYNSRCTSGNECETGLCIGGPFPDGGAADAGTPHFCSKECAAQEECEAPLSRCETLLNSLCIAP